MDRREFLKSLFAAGIATAINIEAAIEQTLIDCVNLSDKDFVAYITYTVSMYISNPAQCMIITNIEEPEGY